MFWYVNSHVFEVFLVWCFILKISFLGFFSLLLSFFIEQKLLPGERQELSLLLGIKYHI